MKFGTIVQPIRELLQRYDVHQHAVAGGCAQRELEYLASVS
jgi:hypothetical protein